MYEHKICNLFYNLKYFFLSTKLNMKKKCKKRMWRRQHLLRFQSETCIFKFVRRNEEVPYISPSHLFVPPDEVVTVLPLF